MQKRREVEMRDEAWLTTKERKLTHRLAGHFSYRYHVGAFLLTAA